MRIKILSLVIAVAAITHCNNYGFVSKLENPSGSSSGSNSSKYYIFVSSRTTAGNMAGLNNGNCAGGGQIQADCSCNDAANAGGLSRQGIYYIAWLSTPVNEMRCRIAGVSSGGTGCSPTGGPTWYNTLDEVVAVGYSGLLSGSLTAQIRYTENRVASAASNVWTATLANGASSGNNCSGWTSTAGNGDKGDVGANTTLWTASNNMPCTTSLPVYCLAVNQ